MVCHPSTVPRKKTRQRQTPKCKKKRKPKTPRMDAQFSAGYARQSLGGGHGETEEMQHMLEFLDASLITPPSANGSPADQPPSHQQTHPQQHPHQQLTVEQLREMTALHDGEDSAMYNELGEVIDLLGSLDANDSDPAQLLQPHEGTFGALLQQQRYSESVSGGHGSSTSVGMNPAGFSTSTAAPPAAVGGDAVASSQKVQLPRSMSLSSSHSGVDSISPVGLLGGPSMSPATINWLQSLVPSTSSESLTGLISPATLYSASGGSVSGLGSVGSLGGLMGSAGGVLPADANGSSATKSGGIPRTPSCEMIDWKAYNDACGVAEKTQKEPAKWRVIPQHGPHADPAASAGVSTIAGASLAKPPPGVNAVESCATGGPSSSSTGPSEISPSQMNAAMLGMHVGNGAGAEVASEDSGLRTHLTRQLHNIKSIVMPLVGALSAPGSPSAEVNGTSQDQQRQQAFDFTPTTSAVTEAASNGALSTGLSAQQQMQLAAKRMAEEKNKRKAIVSPEYVQYGNPASSTATGSSGDHVNAVKVEPAQYATQVPEPTGRRPFKKSLHQTAGDLHSQQQLQYQPSMSSPSALSSTDEKEDGVRCKCTGKCRNARCACVKAGLVCGAQCKCVSCANPFVPMAREGIDIQLMVRDVCLMQYLSKVKDMQELLDSTVSYECCEGGGGVVQVKHTVESGFACPHCSAHFTYSWCSNRLCPDAKKPRRHCAKCRRCGDHRNQHCDLCNHCYFAGVANSFRCSCQSTGGKSSGSSGVKTRAVVPNPVHRDSQELDLGSVTKNGVQQNERPQLFGAINPAAEGASGRDENTDANDGATTGGADGEADDSCKMQ
ncbi:hypothetical protein BBJ28_00014075 [Nothophytophthora sp. Chile5]|nr:hypothetical protein BBJ28_00014075 [Nothophytophthora sp. Chile5]